MSSMLQVQTAQLHTHTVQPQGLINMAAGCYGSQTPHTVYKHINND